MRYIGSKTKLLGEIEAIINENAVVPDGATLCDIFSGTCAVGDWFQSRFRIIGNDNLYFSYIVTRGKLMDAAGFFGGLGLDPFEYFNGANTDEYTQGYCYNTFSPKAGRQYFSEENAKLIDFIRDEIERWHDNGQIDIDEHDYLLACLLESVSKVSNVAGVYAAFLHKWDPRAVKRMRFIPVEKTGVTAHENVAYNTDAVELARTVGGDILYIDPPYTSTQYISQYHVLETIAKNDKPITHGVGAHRDNGEQISKWSKKGAVEAEFLKLLAVAEFGYIVVSYSDAGLMSKEFIEKALKRYAVPGTFTVKKIDFVKYKNTRAVNRENKLNTKEKKHFEWLFFIEKNPEPKYISPLNYIGGKYPILDFLKQNMPKNGIKTFFDLFGGGATVALNSDAERTVCNDLNFNVIGLLEFLKNTDINLIYKNIVKNIKKFGLKKEDKTAYAALRAAYNAPEPAARNPVLLYLLICYGFEHQIRYNSKMEFNNPCGNSGFNDEMLEKLISYNYRANEIDLQFFSRDYAEFEAEITPEDFVYCDPPYLLTCGAYNDGKRGFNGWDGDQQRKLLEFLDRLNARGVRFMLSNMLERDNEENTELINWVNKNDYKIIYNGELIKRNRQDRRELIIINY